jgi:hypothetical protein
MPDLILLFSLRPIAAFALPHISLEQIPSVLLLLGFALSFTLIWWERMSRFTRRTWRAIAPRWVASVKARLKARALRAAGSSPHPIISRKTATGRTIVLLRRS